MIKSLPTKHLLLIAAVSILLAIVLIAVPEEKSTNNTISVEASFEVIDQSKLVFQDLKKPIPNSKVASSTSLPLNETNYIYEIPTPDTLVKKNSPPTFKTQSVEVKAGDSLSKVLSSEGVTAQDIYKVSLADKTQKTLLQMRPGQTLNFTTNETSSELTQLTLTLNRLDSVTFERNGDKFDRKEASRTPEITQTYKEAEINNSLFVDGLKSGIDQPLLIELANIFGWDIDFALDIRKGDSLSVLYEEKFLDGEKIGHGNIIATQFINNGRTFQAIRYETKKGANYYTPDGLAMRKAFIRTPVDFTRISSKFNPNRLHPVFKTTRPHRGVDYAAASGTPVKAAGDGKISFAGKQNGYGNVVIIDHGKGYQTLYAHLRGFARGTKRGARVQQGKIIAYVGQTGWATGPHLHYEFRINGTHKNPVTVKLPNDDPMPKSDLKNFLPYAQEVVTTLTESHSPSFAQKLALLKN
ncbi:peptidoglycan DD-metalloendopeptidase family protein [Marinomonas sp. M1K-6]|uniref:Peptidoglycan DD-metalloendopeptidase family protein n=1 Tax=Marinomonas profundi TaxID=2726122 RepID=A0A847RD78_9GAMM|nr:peptidoglycan DD-metalloendopeptidase family protein [Marinomonas profundi]NLQ19004.1 peptidoglycan DD-metalloendopeptidase family protein [Marinomonas profundi]UDV02083.1 peptidoglycan DD-metalloendopeptidase family protein [Marinomonas profundi]